MITNAKESVKAQRTLLIKVVSLITAIAILCAVTAFATTPSSYNVEIVDGDTSVVITTNKGEPEDILKQADITLAENDKVNVDSFTPGTDSKLVVYRAANIVYTSNDGTTTNEFFAGTVNEFFASKGITLSEELGANYSGDTVLKEGMNLVLKNAMHVTVKVDGNEIPVTILQGTVADALQKAGVTIQDNNETNITSDSELSDGLVIEVFAVEVKTRTVTEKIPFTKENQETDTLTKGTTKLVQKGEDGSKEVTYKDKYLDGQLVSSTVENETVTKQAVNQVTQVGTKQAVVLKSLKNGGKAISELTPPAGLEIVNGVPTSYKRVVSGKAASYSAKPTAKTASGRTVKPGHIAVNPKQFPYGTELWIVSTDGIVYGYSIAADTGGFVHQGKFTVDLFMNSNAECRQWGAKDVLIYVL